MEKELERGNLDLFLYTKVASARFFHDLGFYEIARARPPRLYGESADGFRHCLSRFERETQAFLAERGIAGFGNVVLHASGPYIISNATFPSYFLPDDDTASVGHAELDLTLFAKIAAALSIRRCYVGEEPFSQVTGLYNKVMREKLPELGVECRVIPRLAIAGRAVSASDVRQCVKDGDWQHLQELVPKATYDWLRSDAAAPLPALRRAGTGLLAQPPPFRRGFDEAHQQDAFSIPTPLTPLN